MASIHFLDSPLAIIHIPLELLDLFICPILQILSLVGEGEDEEGVRRRPYAFSHPFANISITVQEVSVICPRQLVATYFDPILASIRSAVAQKVAISRDDYMAISVGAADVDAGQRVLRITAPLAMAGINLFYITSYYSDFVLVPQRSRASVVDALQDQGFVFLAMPGVGGAHTRMTSLSSTTLAHRPLSGLDSPTHERDNSSPLSASSSGGLPPSKPIPIPASLTAPSPTFPSPPIPSPTPTTTTTTNPTPAPAASIADWQTRTFASLANANIAPVLDTSLRLVSAAAHRSDDRATQARLHSAITCCLLMTRPHPPRFLSLTLSDGDSISLTLDRALLPRFFSSSHSPSLPSSSSSGGGGGSGSILLMSDEVTVPIMLDLRNLPDESTGIVCGVAGRLIDRMSAAAAAAANTSDAVLGCPAFSMSYLSTARGGHVIVSEDEVDDALKALKDISVEQKG